VHRFRNFPPLHFALYPLVCALALALASHHTRAASLRRALDAGAFAFLAVAALVAVGLLVAWKKPARWCACGRLLVPAHVAYGAICDIAERVMYEADIISERVEHKDWPSREEGVLVASRAAYDAQQEISERFIEAMATMRLYASEQKGVCAICVREPPRANPRLDERELYAHVHVEELLQNREYSLKSHAFWWDA
jgi:hypothetical protein